MIFYQHYRKDYVNPYRTGVKIGNYNEDLFGVELNEKYKNVRPNPKMYLSENHDKFINPGLRPKSAVPKPCFNQTSDFDLNIDLNNKNLKDYMNLQLKNENFIDENNMLYQNQLMQKEKSNTRPQYAQFNQLTTQERQNLVRPQSSYNFRVDPNQYFHGNVINNQNEFSVGYNNVNYHNRNMNNVPENNEKNNKNETDKDNDVKRSLLFGHGKKTKEFYKTEYATINQLALGEREKTDKFLDPKYKIKKNFMFQPKMVFNNRDWNFRNYKIYDEFTKKFDVPKNLPHK